MQRIRTSSQTLPTILLGRGWPLQVRGCIVTFFHESWISCNSVEARVCCSRNLKNNPHKPSFYLMWDHIVTVNVYLKVGVARWCDGFALSCCLTARRFRVRKMPSETWRQQGRRGFFSTLNVPLDPLRLLESANVAGASSPPPWCHMLNVHVSPRCATWAGKPFEVSSRLSSLTFPSWIHRQPWDDGCSFQKRKVGDLCSAKPFRWGFHNVFFFQKATGGVT